MKRSHLWSSGLALLAMILVAMPARAQLNMQMGNGWSMAFSGNVNGFLTYESTDKNGTTGGGLVGAGTKGFNIRTGLLPTFAVFSIKGRDNGRDLGANFGFAPEIQCGGSSPNYTNRANCQGTQLDMRQVFMTVGGVLGCALLLRAEARSHSDGERDARLGSGRVSAAIGRRRGRDRTEERFGVHRRHKGAG